MAGKKRVDFERPVVHFVGTLSLHYVVVNCIRVRYRLRERRRFIRPTLRRGYCYVRDNVNNTWRAMSVNLVRK